MTPIDASDSMATNMNWQPKAIGHNSIVTSKDLCVTDIPWMTSNFDTHRIEISMSAIG
jgi:hypothetical protein